MNFFIPIILLLAVSAFPRFSYAGNGTPSGWSSGGEKASPEMRDIFFSADGSADLPESLPGGLPEGIEDWLQTPTRPFTAWPFALPFSALGRASGSANFSGLCSRSLSSPKHGHEAHSSQGHERAQNEGASCAIPLRPIGNYGVFPGAAMNDIAAGSVSVLHDQILNLLRQVQGILHHESQVLADFKDRFDQAIADPGYCSLNRAALLKAWEEMAAAIRLIRGVDQGIKSLRDQLYALNRFSLDLAAAELEYGGEWCQVEELLDEISEQVIRVRANFLPICSFPEGRRIHPAQ